VTSTGRIEVLVFERYTESARRALFFTRYETSAPGGAAIETEHLLLGLVREAEGITRDLLARANVSLEGLRKEIRSRALPGERVPTSVEIPFSPDTKRILAATAAEAEGLGHHDIGTEHLLLACCVNVTPDRRPSGVPHHSLPGC